MKKNGFTLIELLLILAIIGIIAAIAIPALLGQKRKQQESARETVMMTVEEMVTTYGPPDRVDKMDNGYNDLSFAYYKQTDMSTKVFTIKHGKVINETRKPRQ